MTAPIALVLGAALVAVVTDVRSRRIPNLLVLAVFLCGALLAALAGWQALASDLVATLVAFGAGAVLFSLRVLGGGDVKLVAAAAGVLGYRDAPAFLLYTMLAGGVAAVAYAAARGRLGESLTGVRTLALPLFAGVAPARVTQGLKMPYAIAILAGALCLLASHTVAPFLRLPL